MENEFRITMNKRFWLVIIFAAALRAGTFFHPHDGWDELFYNALAMKLDTGGLQQYNLRGVAVNKIPPNGWEIVINYHTDKTVLGEFRRKGFTYYDEPLFYEPPLFSYIIRFSHDLFSEDGKYYIYTRSAWEKAKHEGRVHYLKELFYAAIVPLFFSLLTIALVFWFCSKYINENTAFYASLFLAVSPIHVLAGSKIWTDSSGAFFFTSALLCFYLACLEDSMTWTLLSGMLGAFAVLTRVSNLMLLPITVVYFLYHNRLKKFPNNLFDQKMALFLSLVFLITLPWFLTVNQTFGFPLHLPHAQNNYEKLFGFVNFVRHRPWFTYMLNIVVQNPAWILLLLIPVYPLNKDLKFYLMIWIFIPLTVLTVLPMFLFVSIEDRYALIVYPAISVCAGYVIGENCKKPLLQRVWFYLFVLFSLIWSFSLIYKYVYVVVSDSIPYPV
jgi:hypothetical protein